MDYKNNCKQFKDTIVDNFSKSQCIENFFTQQEIELLSTYQFKNTERLKWTATSNNIQPVIDIDTMFKTFDWLDNKFNKIFDNDLKLFQNN